MEVDKKKRERDGQVAGLAEAAQGADIAAQRVGRRVSSIGQHPLFGPDAELVLAGQSKRPSLR